MRRHAGATFSGLMYEHTAFWEKVWNVLDIEIEGDPSVSSRVCASPASRHTSRTTARTQISTPCARA
jgi:hypothetical protein